MDLQYYLILFLPIIVTTVVYFIIAAGVQSLFKRYRLPVHLKSSIELILYGPLAVALIGYGFLLFDNAEYLKLNFPSIAVPANALFLIELVFLLVTISAGVKIGKMYVKLLSERPGAERYLSLGLYSLGLMGLFYVLFSSPISHPLFKSTLQAINFTTGLIVTYIVVHIVNMVFQKYQTMVQGKKPSLQTILTFSRRILLAVVALIGVAAVTFGVFPNLGAAVASLFIAAGFTSIVIGLAAQSTLSNIIAGIVVSSAQPFRIGDALSYAGEWAWVEDVKLNFTVLRTWDNRRLIVPNQMFLNSTMINYDLIDSSKLCVVYVSITYDSDLDKAIEILKETARDHPDFLPSGNLPVVHVMDLGDANKSFSDANASPGILLRVLGRAKDQPTNFQMSKDILYQAKKKFDAAGIKLAFPKRDVVLRNEQDAPAVPKKSEGRRKKQEN